MLREEFSDDAKGPRDTEPPPVPEGQPWGFWATLGFSVLALLLALTAALATTVIGSVYLAVVHEGTVNLKHFDEAFEDEAVDVYVYWIICGVMVLLTVLFARIKRGITLNQYFALKPVPLRAFAPWVAAALVAEITYLLYCGLFELPLSTGSPGISHPDSRFVRFALILPLLDSIGTTLFFQGFLFAGFQSSRIGTPGAILLIVAIYWAPDLLVDSTHENVIEMVEVLLLTLARWRTNSLYPVLAMEVLSSALEAAAVLLFKLPVV